MKWCRSQKKSRKRYKRNNRSGAEPFVTLSTLRGRVAQHHRLLALLEQMEGFSTRQKNHELALAILKDVIATEQLEMSKCRLRQSGFGVIFMCSMIWLTLLNLNFPELVGTQDDLYACNEMSFDEKLIWNFFSLVLVVTAVQETLNIIVIDSLQWHCLRDSLKSIPMVYNGLSYVPSVLNVFFMMGFFVFLTDVSFSNYQKVKALSMGYCQNASVINQQCQDALDSMVGQDPELRQWKPLLDHLFVEARFCRDSIIDCQNDFIHSIASKTKSDLRLQAMRWVYSRCVEEIQRIHRVYHPDMHDMLQDFWSYLLSMMILPLYASIKFLYYCRQQLNIQQQRLAAYFYQRHLDLMQDDGLFNGDLSSLHYITPAVAIVTLSGSVSDCTALMDYLDTLGNILYVQSKSAHRHRLLFRTKVTLGVICSNLSRWNRVLRYYDNLKNNRTVLPMDSFSPLSRSIAVPRTKKLKQLGVMANRRGAASPCKRETQSPSLFVKTLQWTVLNKTYCYDESSTTGLVDPLTVFKINNSCGGQFYVCFTASLVALYLDKQEPVHHLIKSVLEKLKVVKARGETGIVVCKRETRHSKRADSGCFLKIKSPSHKVRIWAGLFYHSMGNHAQPPLYRFDRVTDGVTKKTVS